MQDQAFTGGEANTELPIGPLNMVSGDLEGRPFGLGDGNGFEVGAGFSDVLGQVVTAGTGDRDRFGVLDLNNDPGAQVVEHNEVLDRVRVGVVGRIFTHEDQGTHQTRPPGFFTEPAH